MHHKKILTGILTLSSINVYAIDFSVLGKDVSISGFATLGYAQTDQPYKYQRYLSNDGSFLRDSLLGLQLDTKLTDTISVTAQGKFAAANDADNSVDTTLTWAFLSWRPTNNLLFRGGRLRVPLYMNSQNMDIGATFDFARLPAEVYFTSPLNNFDGVSMNKTWDSSIGEFTFDGYVGTLEPYFRIAPYNYNGLRDNAYYMPVRTDAYGGALTLQREENIFRIGVHDTYNSRLDGGVIRDTLPFVQLAPNVGYYKVSDSMLGAPIPSHNQVHTIIYTAGIDLSLGNNFRLMSEFVRREVYNSLVSPDSQGGYLAISKSIGDWTPYVSIAHLQSMGKTLDLYNRVSQNRLPAAISGAAQLNATQRAGSVGIFAYDQTTWAVGTSYSINPTNKIKAEWALTKTGDVSALIDPLPNGDTRDKLLNTFSVSYNIVF
jgi:hypothetical protein